VITVWRTREKKGRRGTAGRARKAVLRRGTDHGIGGVANLREKDFQGRSTNRRGPKKKKDAKAEKEQEHRHKGGPEEGNSVSIKTGGVG